MIEIRRVLLGPIEVLNFSYFEQEFPETFRTAVQIRAEIAERGWKKVVAFQTRKPMHRAHEELCKMAQEAVGADGVLIHMLLGKLKAGDIPAHVRDAAIRKMVELYFPANTVMITGYARALRTLQHKTVDVVDVTLSLIFAPLSIEPNKNQTATAGFSGGFVLSLFNQPRDVIHQLLIAHLPKVKRACQKVSGVFLEHLFRCGLCGWFCIFWRDKTVR